VFKAASQNSFNASSHNSDAKLTAIYAAQPALLVFALESTSLPLMPKSQSFTQPPRSSKMLEGFTSRKVRKQCYRPVALTSQLLRVSSSCSLTIGSFSSDYEYEICQAERMLYAYAIPYWREKVVAVAHLSTKLWRNLVVLTTTFQKTKKAGFFCFSKIINCSVYPAQIIY
jgi:hypothetical protein